MPVTKRVSRLDQASLVEGDLRGRWVLLANRADAVLYRDGSDQRFHFLARLKNPKGKRREHDLVSDRPGRGASSANPGAIRHSLDRGCTHDQTIAKHFAGQIAQTLSTAHRQKKFRSVVLVAEPRFLGVLRDSLPKSVRKSVCREINKEFVSGSDRDHYEQVRAAIRERGE